MTQICWGLFPRGRFLCNALSQLSTAGLGLAAAGLPGAHWGPQGSPAPTCTAGHILGGGAAPAFHRGHGQATGQEHSGSFFFLHFVFFKSMDSGPLPQHTASLSPGAATAMPTGTRAQAAGRWLSHCSARGCARLLQPQGSAQPAGEVHLLPLRAFDEGMVLKEAGYQSQPESPALPRWPGTLSGGCAQPPPAPVHKLPLEELHIPGLGQVLQGKVA